MFFPVFIQADEPDYFTITNLASSGNLTIEVYKNNATSSPNLTLHVRILNESGVVTQDWQEHVTTAQTCTIAAIPAKGKAQIYGSNPCISCRDNNTNYTNSFVFRDKDAKVSGNLLSLVACADGSTIDNDFVMPTACFSSLFSSTTYKLKDAEDLILPSTTVADYGYASMFSGSKSLQKAPKSLPATTIGKYAYSNMFNGCTALTVIPSVLPASAMAAYCYYYMFNGCTALQNAPVIAASTTAQNACERMFMGCTALTTPPPYLLPQTVQTDCYKYMFSGCSALTYSPDIHLTSLSSSCFQCLFENCTNLSFIRTHITAWNGNSTKEWIKGITQQEGVIYCPPQLERTIDGTNKMPLSADYPWKIYSYDLTFIPVGGNWTDGQNDIRRFTWETDTTEVIDFFTGEAADNEEFLGFYTDANLTIPISAKDIQALLSTQQETATRNIYVGLVDYYSTLEINDNESDAYYTRLLSVYYDHPMTVQLNRTFFGYMWNTVCLPFNLSLAGTPFENANVVRFSDAKGDVATEGLYLEFESVSEMYAGVPYLMKPQATIVNPVFRDVSITTFTGSSVSGSAHPIKYVGAVKPVELAHSDCLLLVGKENNLYYSDGGKMRGLRAYFDATPVMGMRPRAQIVVRSSTPTRLEELQGDNDQYGENEIQNTPARKYMQNGRLIIERSGKKYNAQGDLIE